MSTGAGYSAKTVCRKSLVWIVVRYFFLHVIPCSLVERYIAVSLANANLKMFVSGMKQILLVYGFRSCVHCLITLSKKKKTLSKKKKVWSPSVTCIRSFLRNTLFRWKVRIIELNRHKLALATNRYLAFLFACWMSCRRCHFYISDG